MTRVRTLASSRSRNELTRCCWPGCGSTAGELDAPLCRKHLLDSWRIVQEIATTVANSGRDDVEQIAPPYVPPATRADGERGTVYFIRFSDRVKIGWTGNLAKRLADLPHDELLHAQPGTRADERRCHVAFAHHRVMGEWFRAEPDLLAFIGDLQRNAA